MSTTEGTTTTGTDVQHVADVSERALVALDAQLIGNLNAALTRAEKTAGMFVSDMAEVAVSVLELHAAETWTRTIDSETGQLYPSAKSFYAALNRQDRFPHLHRILRTELVGTLMDGDKLTGIGVNELAALIGCNPAQISRDVKALAPAPDEAEAEAALEAELDAVAEAAMAEAYKSNPDITEAEVNHAIEAARSEAKAALKAKAEAEATRSEVKAKVAAEAKATDKAGKVFVTAVQGVRDHFHLMTAERQAEVLDEAESLVAELQTFVKLQAEATKPKTRRNTPRSKGGTQEEAKTG